MDSVWTCKWHDNSIDDLREEGPQSNTVLRQAFKSELDLVPVVQYMALGKLLNLSKPHFPHSSNEDKKK